MIKWRTARRFRSSVRVGEARHCISDTCRCLKKVKRAGLLHDKFKKREERLIRTKPQFVETCNACWALGGENTIILRRRFIILCRSHMSGSLIMTLLPQRPAFTAVNQSRSDNKQQRDKCRQWTEHACFTSQLHWIKMLPIAVMHRSSSSADWPWRNTSRKYNTWGKSSSSWISVFPS